MKQATELNERTLWYDGDSTVPADSITGMVSAGMSTSGLFVEELTNDIEQFNQFVPDDEKITIKGDVRDLEFGWTIPKEFQELDVEEYVIDKLLKEDGVWFPISADAVTSIMRTHNDRVSEELKLYKSQGLYDVLRVLIYIINTLRSNDIVWGVGRGSSVSSYILYLIGVHDVDSVKYNLDITDFLRSGE